MHGAAAEGRAAAGNGTRQQTLQGCVRTAGTSITLGKRWFSFFLSRFHSLFAIRAFIWRQSELFKLLLLGSVLSLRKTRFSSELWLEYRDDKTQCGSLWVFPRTQLLERRAPQLWGSPQPPGLSTVPQPGSQSRNLLHKASEATQHQGGTGDNEATEPPHSPMALRDPQL